MQFLQIFSRFARKTTFSEKKRIKHIYKNFIQNAFYTLSFPLYPRFPQMFSLFAHNGGFMTFEFL